MITSPIISKSILYFNIGFTSPQKQCIPNDYFATKKCRMSSFE